MLVRQNLASGQCLGLRSLHYTVALKNRPETHANTRKPKETGTIAAIFTSLSGSEASQLPARFSDLKKSLWKDSLIESWRQVLEELHERVATITERGTEVRSSRLNNWRCPKPFLADNTPNRVQRPEGWLVRCPNCEHKGSGNRSDQRWHSQRRTSSYSSTQG